MLRRIGGTENQTKEARKWQKPFKKVHLLLLNVDRALYQAKTEGRDRFAIL